MSTPRYASLAAVEAVASAPTAMLTTAVEALAPAESTSPADVATEASAAVPTERLISSALTEPEKKRRTSSGVPRFQNSQRRHATVQQPRRFLRGAATPGLAPRAAPAANWPMDRPREAAALGSAAFSLCGASMRPTPAPSGATEVFRSGVSALVGRLGCGIDD